MTWFKVDDGFWGHPKQTALPAAPVALWVRAGSWSGSQLTDGFVPAHMVTMLGAKKRDAEQLVAAGLWESVDGGFQFHDWAKWQPTRDDVEKKRAEDAERKAEWRRKKAEQRAAEAAEAEMSQRDSDRTDAVTPRGVRSSRPDPTRPDPTRSSPTEKSDTSRTTSRGDVPESNAPAKPPLYPDRCKRHGNVAEPPPCGACADARKANAAKTEVLPDYRMRVIVPLCGKCDDRWINTPTGAKHCPRCHPAEITSQQGDCSYHPGHPMANCTACEEAREAYIKGRSA